MLTVRTPMGRKKRADALSHGLPLVRTKPGDLAASGIERVPRVTGVRDGRPELEGGRVLDVSNVVWCTGSGPDLDWVDLPGVARDDPATERGIVTDQPGLYFIGLLLLYSVSSAMVHGLARGAEHVAKHIASRNRRTPVAFDQAHRGDGEGEPDDGGTDDAVAVQQRIA